MLLLKKYNFKEKDMPLKKFSEFLKDPDEDEPPRDPIRQPAPHEQQPEPEPEEPVDDVDYDDDDDKEEWDGEEPEEEPEPA
jgi:hypothetical protein